MDEVGCTTNQNAEVFDLVTICACMDAFTGRVNPYAHRYSTYLRDLRRHWAYKDTPRLPARNGNERNLYWCDSTTTRATKSTPDAVAPLEVVENPSVAAHDTPRSQSLLPTISQTG